MDNIDKIISALNKAIDEFDHNAVAHQSGQLLSQMEASLAEHPDKFCKALKEYANQFDFEQVNRLCDQLATHLQGRDTPYPDAIANTVLKTLQRKRLFAKMLVLADLFIQSGSKSQVVQRRFAQALIDQSHYSAAENVLKRLVEECRDKKNIKELAEAQGLLGRLYKQTYINAASQQSTAARWAKEAFKQSFDCYHSVYMDSKKDKKYLWHGINAVAVWHRARKDGIVLPVTDISSTTQTILDSIGESVAKDKGSESQKRTDMWAMATAAEACIAMQQYHSALGWLDKYIGADENTNGKPAIAPDSDAFEIGSTLRQFEEVWQLDENHEEHSRILQVLRAALLQREGGSISLDKPQQNLQTIDGILSDESFEAVFGQERFKNLKWLKTGFERAQGVCKITDKFGEAFGTGFLVQSGDLRLPGKQRLVVLTNAHVVSNDPTEQRGSPKAKSPETVKIQFEAGDDPDRVYDILRILATSPRHELDFSVLELKETVEFTKPYPIARALPLIDEDQRIYLIGHPRGGQLSFSLYDNLLLDHEPPKVHYRSPSLGGSSGSPVFNQAWDLIGLHHAGGEGMQRLNGKAGTYSANEGLWIESIVSTIDAQKHVDGTWI